MFLNCVVLWVESEGEWSYFLPLVKFVVKTQLSINPLCTLIVDSPYTPQFLDSL